MTKKVISSLVREGIMKVKICNKWGKFTAHTSPEASEGEIWSATVRDGGKFGDKILKTKVKEKCLILFRSITRTITLFPSNCRWSCSLKVKRIKLKKQQFHVLGSSKSVLSKESNWPMNARIKAVKRGGDRREINQPVCTLTSTSSASISTWNSLLVPGFKIMWTTQRENSVVKKKKRGGTKWGRLLSSTLAHSFAVFDSRAPLPILRHSLFGFLLEKMVMVYKKQWWIQGRGPSPLFLDQTEARRTKKKLGETVPPLISGVRWPGHPL